MMEATKDRKVLSMEHPCKTHPPRSQKSEEVSHQETIINPMSESKPHAPDRNAGSGTPRQIPPTPLSGTPLCCQRRREP